MKPRFLLALAVALLVPVLAVPILAQQQKSRRAKLDIAPKPIATDKSIKYDYDIVYVRAPRNGDKARSQLGRDRPSRRIMEPGADLMLLHPDGRRKCWSPGGKGSVTDPYVSFDGEWVYYAHFHDAERRTDGGAGHLQDPRQDAQDRPADRTRSSRPTPAPPTGRSDFRTPEKGKTHLSYGVYNLGPCPLPGGKVVFTSNRDGFKPPQAIRRHACSSSSWTTTAATSRRSAT